LIWLLVGLYSLEDSPYTESPASFPVSQINKCFIFPLPVVVISHTNLPGFVCEIYFSTRELTRNIYFNAYSFSMQLWQFLVIKFCKKMNRKSVVSSYKFSLGFLDKLVVRKIKFRSRHSAMGWLSGKTISDREIPINLPIDQI
jgi:hypothetical protein